MLTDIEQIASQYSRLAAALLLPPLAFKTLTLAEMLGWATAWLKLGL